MTYRDALTAAMTRIALDHPNALFLGQAVEFPGTAMTPTLDGVPLTQRVELPVFENTQLGLSTGLALAGFLPVSIFPRWNFLLAAADQLVNHLDALPLYSAYRPGVLIRVAVPTATPMHPGPQHLGDFTEPFRKLLRTVQVVNLRNRLLIGEAYRDAALAAARYGRSTLLVEHAALYDDV